MYDVDPVDSLHQVPDERLPALAELRVALEVTPWIVGRPWAMKNPTGMRVVTVAEGRAAGVRRARP